jgi:hypothetical protein
MAKVKVKTEIRSILRYPFESGLFSRNLSAKKFSRLVVAR